MRIFTLGLVATLLVSAAAAARAPAKKLDQIAWQETAQPITQQLANLGKLDPSFASVALDTQQQRIIVYRQGGAADGRYTSMIQTRALNVVFRPALLTAAQTKRLMDNIWKARPELRAAGVDVVSVTTDGSGPVTVTVKQSGLAVQEELLARYGTGTVQVRQGESPEIMNRFDDDTPYYGGNRIVSATGTWGDGTQKFGSCTSGFGGLANTGTRYVLTAFHCLKPGDPRMWTANENNQGVHYIGSAGYDQAHDIAFIPSSTLPYIWDGPIHPYYAQFTKRVTAMADPAIGMNICTSGSVSGARCYARISGSGHYNLCGTWYGQGCWDVYLWYATNSSGTSMSQGGDSGGPVFMPHSDRTTITAVGIISGSANNGTTVYFPAVRTEAYLDHGINLTQ